MKPSAALLWPVRCAPVGSVAVGSVLWRFVGQLYCTAIVKVTFGLSAQGVMPRINPSPLRRSDDYLHGRPTLAGGGECAPRMDLAEATVVGHAYANPRAAKRSVRFTMVRGDKVLIDKTLYIYGDRVKGGAPKPFRTMRISWERALGGLEFPRNPIGVGMDKDSSRRPNILDPRRPKDRPAGFGPYPARFQRRRQYRGDVPLELIEGGIADYPDDFAWKYFQAAPSDQRIAEIRGDEWILLEGLHRDHERMRARLPYVCGLCRVYSRQDVGAPEWVDMKATLLHIEPDDDRCSLIFRGWFPLASEMAAQELVLAGAVQCGREPVVWPAGLHDIDMFASPMPPQNKIAGRADEDMMQTAVSAAGRAKPPARNLGLGYRLGEAKMEVAAPPVSVIDAELLADVDVTEDEIPPEMPYSDIPPPPSYRARAPAGVPDPAWPDIPPPARVPTAPPHPSYPDMPAADLYGSYAYSSQAYSSEAYTQVYTSQPQGPYSDPQASVPRQGEHPLSTTDEMEDAEGDASDDAAAGDGAQTIPAPPKRFDKTEMLQDGESDHPLAVTQVVRDDDK